jgi:hypothetical protein
VNEYKGQTIYTVGILPAELLAGVPAPMNELKDIAVGLTFGSDLKIKAASNAGSADNAKVVSDQVNGLKALASGMGQGKPELEKILKDFIDPLKLVPQGSKITLDVTYSKDVIDGAMAAIPALMMLGLGANGADSTLPVPDEKE